MQTTEKNKHQENKDINFLSFSQSFLKKFVTVIFIVHCWPSPQNIYLDEM